MAMAQLTVEQYEQVLKDQTNPDITKFVGAAKKSGLLLNPVLNLPTANPFSSIIQTPTPLPYQPTSVIHSPTDLTPLSFTNKNKDCLVDDGETVYLGPVEVVGRSSATSNPSQSLAFSDILKSEAYNGNPPPPPLRANVKNKYGNIGELKENFDKIIEAEDKFMMMKLNKQKRSAKKEKNVLNVFQADDIDGHKGEEDLDSILQRLGEKVETKVKEKKTKRNNEKSKYETDGKMSKSIEMELVEKPCHQLASSTPPPFAFPASLPPSLEAVPTHLYCPPIVIDAPSPQASPPLNASPSHGPAAPLSTISALIPECPVCLEDLKPPLKIFSCENGHLICSTCRTRVKKCHCQAVYMGRATAMEQMVRQILGIM